MQSILSNAHLILHIIELTASNDPTGSLLWKLSLCSTVFSRAFILPISMSQFRSSLRSKYIVEKITQTQNGLLIKQYLLNDKLHQEGDLPAHIDMFTNIVIKYWLRYGKFYRINGKPIMKHCCHGKFWIKKQIMYDSPGYEMIFRIKNWDKDEINTIKYGGVHYCYCHDKVYELTNIPPFWYIAN